MEHLLEKTFQAEREHFWFKGFRQFISPLIARAVAGLPAPRALDCGCGTGSNLTLLAQHANAFGFDLTMNGLRYAQANGGQRVARGEHHPHSVRVESRSIWSRRSTCCSA